MRMLVTGGAGFIGSHIVDCLIKEGYSTLIVDNLSTGKEININNNAHFIKADVTQNLDDIFEAEKPDIVIHTAAHTRLRISFENAFLDAKTNILGTINVLEACVKNKVKRLIYTSTGGARFGEPTYHPVDEKHSINPESPYGLSKQTAERYVELYYKKHGLDSLTFCFGNVYGKRDCPESGRIIPLFYDIMQKGESPVIFGDGNQTRDFVYVDDLSDFIVKSISCRPEHSLFNLASGTETSVNEVFNLLKDLTGFIGKPTYVEPVKGEISHIRLDTSLAKNELGWNPRYGLEDGLNETFCRVSY